jgi:AcrR family transcriptional regulator
MRNTDGPLNGRRAQAAENDTLILDAAREIFISDPGAPISAVAARAGVGIAALYRRYENKEDLLRALARDALARYRDDLLTALADDGDAWTAYCAALERIVAGRSQALAQRLAGTFAPTPEMGALAAETGELMDKLHRRTQRHNALRADVTSADIVLLLEMVMLIEIPGAREQDALRARYLALVLQSLKFPGTAPLPGPAAEAADLAVRWKANGA